MAKEISSELLNTILTRVGGPGNIASCGNCMTRLRLGVHDSSLVDPNIKTLEGVSYRFGTSLGFCQTRFKNTVAVRNGGIHGKRTYNGGRN